MIIFKLKTFSYFLELFKSTTFIYYANLLVFLFVLTEVWKFLFHFILIFYCIFSKGLKILGREERKFQNLQKSLKIVKFISTNLSVMSVVLSSWSSLFFKHNWSASQSSIVRWICSESCACRHCWISFYLMIVVLTLIIMAVI